MRPITLNIHKEFGPGFAASLIDGLSVDVFDLADLECTDELHDALWGERNWRSLIEECESVTLIEIEEHEGGPGMSDTYYWVAVDDLDTFRAEVREIILSA
jgi:hypothetical protein